MRTGRWIVLALALSSCWALDGDDKSSDKRAVIGHRGGVVVRAGDVFGTAPFSWEPAAEPRPGAAAPSTGPGGGQAPCLPGAPAPCCTAPEAASAAASESKNPAGEGKTFPHRRRRALR